MRLYFEQMDYKILDGPSVFFCRNQTNRLLHISLSPTQETPSPLQEVADPRRGNVSRRRWREETRSRSPPQCGRPSPDVWLQNAILSFTQIKLLKP